jgi:hypothetical protein
LSSIRFKFKDEVINPYTGEIKDGYVGIYYKEVIDGATNRVPTDENYAWADGGAVLYDYSLNSLDEVVPVLIFEGETAIEDKLRDKFYYISNEVIDGITYAKWQKIESSTIEKNEQNWTSRVKQFVYTDPIVEENTSPTNNFTLPKKVLHTANKWCTSDILLKLDDTEIHNIKPEYIRAGTSIFGLDGEYGTAHSTATIPAGLYDIVFSPDRIIDASGIPFYHRGKFITNGFYYGFDGNTIKGLDGYTFYAGSSISNPGGTRLDDQGVSHPLTWLDYLIFVPEDVEVDLSVDPDKLNNWYKMMHPYVANIVPETAFNLKKPIEHARTLPGLAEFYEGNIHFHMVFLEATSEIVTEHLECVALGYAPPAVSQTNRRTSEFYYKLADGTKVAAYANTKWRNADVEDVSVSYSGYLYFNRQKVSPEVLTILVLQRPEEIDINYECGYCNMDFPLSDMYILTTDLKSWRCKDCRTKICNHTTGSGSSLVTTYKRLSATNHLATTKCKYCSSYTTSSSEAHTLVYDDTPGHSYSFCSKCNMPDNTANCSEWHDTEMQMPCAVCGLGYTTCPSCGTQWYYSSESYCAHCGYVPGSSEETCPHNNVGDNGYCFDCETFISSGCESGNHVLEGNRCINCGIAWMHCGGSFGDGEYCDNYGWEGTICGTCSKQFGND